MKTNKRYALHMKPGCGPTLEGLLVGKSRSEFVLIAAEVLEDAQSSHDLAGFVTVLRENVFCLQELA